jgi:hypothetical protein
VTHGFCLEWSVMSVASVLVWNGPGFNVIDGAHEVRIANLKAENLE